MFNEHMDVATRWEINHERFSGERINDIDEFINTATEEEIAAWKAHQAQVQAQANEPDIIDTAPSRGDYRRPAAMTYFIESFIEYCDTCEKYHSYALQMSDKGTYFITDSDGDITEENVQLTDERAAAWAENYDNYCNGVKAGKHPDYLGEFPLVDQAENWQFKFAPHINQKNVGILFVGARKNSRGPWLRGDDLPEHVRVYLSLEKHGAIWTCPHFLTTADIKTFTTGVTWQLAHKALAKGLATITFKAEKYPRK